MSDSQRYPWNLCVNSSSREISVFKLIETCLYSAANLSVRGAALCSEPDCTLLNPTQLNSTISEINFLDCITENILNSDSRKPNK